MDLPEEPISIVEQWKKKSYEMSSQSNDSIISLISRGIDTMAVVANKKSDLDRVQRALAILECERSVSLQFDKIKNDEVRSLVYGLIESLHFTLSELTKEGNQVKECCEICTQTEEELSTTSLEFPLSSNDCSHITHNHSHERSELTNERNQVKESVEMLTHKAEEEPSQPSLEDRLTSNNYTDQSRVETLVFPNLFELIKEEPVHETSAEKENVWSNEMAIKDEVKPRDDVIPALSFMEVSDCDYDIEHEDFDETMNDWNADQIMEEDIEKALSETVKLEKKRRSSRIVSRAVLLDDFQSSDYSDKDYEPMVKKLKAKSTKMKNRKTSDVIEKKGGSVSFNGNSRKMKCIECEYQVRCASSFMRHLRDIHSTTLGLSGLAFRCDCGVETLSNNHGYQCDIANFTVVRKRDGPIHRIKDKKTTPQCLLCDAYPRTANGYIQHLKVHHKVGLKANGIYLLCSCGAKYRHCHPDSKHTEECNRIEYTLHTYTDK